MYPLPDDDSSLYSPRLSNADVGEGKEFVIEKGEVECSCQYDKSTQNREPGEMELRVRAKIEEDAVAKMMAAAEMLRLALHARYEAAVKGLPFDAVGMGAGVEGGGRGGSEGEEESEAKGQISAEVQEYVKDLQRSSMKKKFVQAINYFGGGGGDGSSSVGKKAGEGGASSSSSRGETVEEEDAVVDTAGRLLLTYQSLDSSDIKELIAAIKRAPKEITEPVRELWLSNNNAGDGGIQALVTALATGILPNLAMLRVDGNGMSEHASWIADDARGDCGRAQAGAVQRCQVDVT